MRYSGGLLGGAWLSLFAADLGRGQVRRRASRAELREPESRQHALGQVVSPVRRTSTPSRRASSNSNAGGAASILINEEEIRWIVNNLFVGNKLSAGEARLGPGRYFDLKAIKQPIIVFASMGDNITPPQQAFNWIADVYSSTEEIKAQRPDDRRPAAPGRRPPRHLRFRQGREEGTRADRRGAEVHPAAAAGPVRHGHRGALRRATARSAYEVTLKERKVEDLRALQKFDRVDEKPFQAVAGACPSF